MVWQKIGSFECQRSDNKATFAHYSYVYFFGEYFLNDFSIDMCRGHLSYFAVTLHHLEYAFSALFWLQFRIDFCSFVSFLLKLATMSLW